MKKNKRGRKHVCFECGCKFYDLNRPQPVCPKCGVCQPEAKKKTGAKNARRTGVEASPLSSPASSARSRRRKRTGDSWDEEEGVFDTEEEEKTDILEDGLPLVVEDDLHDSEEVENSELD